MNDVFQPGTQFWTAQWVLPVSAEPIEQGFIAVVEGKITAVGKIADLPKDLGVLLAETGSLLTPGLINTHTHLEQSYPQVIGKASDESFSDWLLAVVRQNREQGLSEHKKARALLGCNELLATGTTCLNDLSSGPEALQILDEKGLRGYVSLEFFHPDTENLQIDGLVAAYRKMESEKYSRLQLGFSPHSPYNFSPSAWKAFLEACNPPVIHAHVAESWDETLYFRNESSTIPAVHQKILGRIFHPQTVAETPVTYLAQHGLLNERTILAHAVHTTETDRKYLADAGVTVTHCPRSNMFLHGQTLRFSDWEASEVVMGLGTDGRVSTENLDLRDEARFAMQLHGWSAKQALKMMTLEGAKALRLENITGSLELGKQADFVLWQTKLNGLSPEELLMLPSTQVQGVWTDGQQRWKATGVKAWIPSSVC
jgi:5-methylthioadenosine/S-adenosylhomocysteine deaminase